MSISKLEVFERTAQGSNAMSQLRKSGDVPGILYGLGREPRLLQFRMGLLETMVRDGERTVELRLGDQSQLAFLKDLQYDYSGDRIIHADFVRVEMDQAITLRIPIKFVGVAAGQAAGGMVDHRLTELEIACLPDRIPEEVEVNLAELQVGQSVHVRELTLPDGVTCPLDAETVIVAVAVPSGVADDELEEEEAAAEGGVEPAVIGKDMADAEETKE